MAFKLGDLLIDRLQFGYAATNDAERKPLYVLSQLSEASIEVTSESTEIKDARGNLIKTVYKAKSGSFTASNAFVNGNIIAITAGQDAQYASATSKITMPRLLVAKAGETVDVKGYVTGTVRVGEYTGDGVLGKIYDLAGAASTADATHFSISGNNLKLPTDSDVKQFLVIFEREVEDGVKITNSSATFPDSVYMLFKALYSDPCDPNNVKAMYIEIPNFQVSPDVTITVNTEATMDLNGVLQMNYCEGEKTLYNVYFVDDEEEAE